ncbi:MAG TPA: hypothetical protein PKV33_07030, partial [Methanothrix sp.]|nr:hypothetical protein [Methanothrix sp.]
MLRLLQRHPYAARPPQELIALPCRIGASGHRKDVRACELCEVTAWSEPLRVDNKLSNANSWR